MLTLLILGLVVWQNLGPKEPQITPSESSNEGKILSELAKITETLKIQAAEITAVKEMIQQSKSVTLNDEQVARIAQIAWTNPVTVGEGKILTPAEIITRAATRGFLSPDIEGYETGPHINSDGTIVAVGVEKKADDQKSEEE